MPLLAVGAAFDFHAGMLSQAPEFMQRNGLEWFYRFVQEPRRLWQRYVVLNPLYVGMLLLQMLKLKQFNLRDTTPPSQELRFG
jgi:UDP-N-acetyl-D-mannosaminuronic acid transferase (WecB/TagA/CpsF family)